jgi:hypothetical protein
MRCASAQGVRSRGGSQSKIAEISGVTDVTRLRWFGGTYKDTRVSQEQFRRVRDRAGVPRKKKKLLRPHQGRHQDAKHTSCLVERP